MSGRSVRGAGAGSGARARSAARALSVPVIAPTCSRAGARAGCAVVSADAVVVSAFVPFASTRVKSVSATVSDGSVSVLVVNTFSPVRG